MRSNTFLLVTTSQGVVGGGELYLHRVLPTVTGDVPRVVSGHSCQCVVILLLPVQG